MQRAYLARVDHGVPGSYEVALCVRGRAGAAVVQLVADSFASIFAKDAHLDTLFLSDVQEAELQKVCRPFFELSSV